MLLKVIAKNRSHRWFCKIIATIIFSLIAFTTLLAQEPTSVNYTMENGLPSNEVYDLFEDKDGYLWVGTNKGAVRFDSKNMQPLTLADGLADKDILSIHQDRIGNIWFLSYNGKLSYWKEGKVYNEKNDDRLSRITSDSYFSAFYEDLKGNLWFGTRHGVFRIDTIGNTKHFTLSNLATPATNDSKNRLSYAVPYLFEDSVGDLFFSNAVGSFIFKQDNFDLLYRHQKRQRKPRFNFHKQRLYSSTNNRITSSSPYNGKIYWERQINSSEKINAVEVLTDELLYIATNKGIYSLDQSGNRLDSFLLGKKVSDLLIDRENNLWASTLYSGIYLIKNREILNYNTSAKFSILKMSDSLLFGGAKLELHSITHNRLKSIPIKFKGNHLISDQDRIILLKEGVGRIWIGTNNGLYSLEDNDANLTLLSGVRDLLFLENDLFIAVNSPYLLKFNRLDYTNNELLSVSKSALADSNRAILKTNSIHSNLFYFLEQTGKTSFLGGTAKGVINYKDSSFQFINDLPFQKAIAIQKESNDNLWILEESAGLFYYRADTKKVDTLIIFPKGLAVTYTSLWLEKDGNIWLGSDKGIAFIEMNQRPINITYLNKKQGLLSNGVNDLIVINDTVWLATNSGLSFFPKKSFRDTVPPLLYIDSIRIGEKVMDFRLLSNSTSIENDLTVYCSGISFRDEGNLSYEYQLAGDFSKMEKIEQSEFSIYNLPPSEYILSIQAIDSSGNRSARQEVNFRIKLLWWKNWKVGLFIGFLLILISFVLLRVWHRRSFQKIYTGLSNQFAFAKKRNFILVKSVLSDQKIKIYLDELLYIQSARDYVEIFLSQQKIVVRSSMKSILEELQEYPGFLRVHKSFVVNLEKVDSHNYNTLNVQDVEIPIGRTYSKAVKEFLSSLPKKE